MITNDELVKAWTTISQFCQEQEHCSKCPLVMACAARLGTEPLGACAAEFIRCI